MMNSWGIWNNTMNNTCNIIYKLYALCDCWSLEILGISIFQIFIIVAGYLITISLSGIIVRFFVGIPPKDEQETPSGGNDSRFDTGTIIGKCENILTVTFILAGEITGLVLVFAAKSLIRKELINEDAKYYLGGTLINFSFSVLMGFLIRILAQIK